VSRAAEHGDTYALACTVNGASIRVDVPNHRTLLDFLRNDLGLIGAKRGCDVQVCGACTVLIDGLPVSACSVLALEAHGRTVETCEGLAQGGRLHPIQQAFVDCGALQCGFCTPGMVITVRALLAECPTPSDAQIVEYMSGNLCRCTGYMKIVEAIHVAARVMAGTGRDGA